MEQRDYLIILYDYYGDLFSDGDHRCFESYYFDNLSLGEIAENYLVSRNAIHKHIKNVESKLLLYEEKLKLYEKDKKVREIIKTINDDGIKNKLEKIFD